METDSHQLHEWRSWFSQRSKSVGTARREAADTLRGWGCKPEAVATIELIVSELTTNVIKHARVPGRLFEVRLEYRGDVCDVEVSDTCDVHPQAVCSDGDAESGRGLALVDTLAEKWGSRDRVIGKTVWARLALDSLSPEP